MNSFMLKKILEEKLSHPDREIRHDREKDVLRIEDKYTKKGISVTLSKVLANYHKQKDKAIDEVVYYIEHGLAAMKANLDLTGKKNKAYPIIRSTSFPTEAKDGVPFFFEEHTAETRIYYALDLGNTYRILDVPLIEQEKWDKSRVKETALFNLRSLKASWKKDMVAGNYFYFHNSNDGYDASRILNELLLKEMEQKIEGTMAVALPHQDVLIVADIRNDTGYDVLAQMTMAFFTNGHVPITSLSFLYEKGELEPIFILGKNGKK